MTDPTTVLSDANPITDVIDSELGDKRMSERYPQLIEALSFRPDASIPETFEEACERKAYYRFVENDKLDFFKLAEPHFDATAERAKQLGEVLVVHDTTTVSFNVHDEVMREHLTRQSTHRQGFLWHTSLVLAADGTRAPLGLVSAQPFVHQSDLKKGDESTRRYWENLEGVFDNESWRWLGGVEESEKRLGEIARVIHVSDRENDDFEHMVCMQQAGYDFVIRATHDRLVSTGEHRKDHEKLSEAFERAPWIGERQIKLSARKKGQASKQHPQRRARVTTVNVRAIQVEVRRPNNVPAAQAPDTIEVMAVEVLETTPPKGEEPVRWVLFTSLAGDTTEAVWKVVDIYRARWVTEEYYRALKSGCGYLKLQHRSADALLNALALKLQVAWQLLAIRFLGQHVEDISADAVTNPLQLQLLQKLKPKFLSKAPTAREVMLAIASLGGHFKHNGEPGWIVLGRGWQKLREYERGARIAMQL